MFVPPFPRSASPGPRRARRRRVGFTLIELLLVLAILVVVAAVSIVALASALENQALSQGTDIFRARIAKCRVEAMRTGKIHLLEYAPQTNQFGISVWEGEILESDVLDADGLIPGSPREIYLGSGQLESGEQPRFGGATEFLPEGVIFVAGQTVADQRTLGAAEDSGTGSGSSSPTQSAPLYFYPDGTTSKSDVVLANVRGAALVVSLRGLTGFTTVSETQTLQGASP